MTTAISVLSNYAGNRALRYLLEDPVYLAAHTSDPTVSGLSSTEVAGGGYLRQRAKLSSPAGKSVSLTNDVQFPGMPACVVTHLAVWDAISGGHLLFIIKLIDSSGNPTPITVLESGALKVPSGDIGVSL